MEAESGIFQDESRLSGGVLLQGSRRVSAVRIASRSKSRIRTEPPCFMISALKIFRYSSRTTYSFPSVATRNAQRILQPWNSKVRSRPVGTSDSVLRCEGCGFSSP